MFTETIVISVSFLAQYWNLIMKNERITVSVRFLLWLLLWHTQNGRGGNKVNSPTWVHWTDYTYT